MKKHKWLIVLLNLFLLLAYVNYAVVQKEEMLTDGKLILLELAPVDPRSLMQGDYMRLGYKVAEGVRLDSIPKRGYFVVRLQGDGVAERLRLQQDKLPVHEGEYLISYTAGKWNLNIGAESFFFQEGQAEKYEKAKYGGLKVDGKGNSLLVGLYDENRQKIE